MHFRFNPSYQLRNEVIFWDSASVFLKLANTQVVMMQFDVLKTQTTVFVAPFKQQ
jgi:hypothetical protein